MDFKVRSCEESRECNWVFNIVTSLSTVHRISVIVEE